MKRSLIALSVLLILTFAGLRIYGAFQTERQDALHRAEQARRTSKLEQDEADAGEAKINCSQSWGNYHLAEQNAELARLTKGDLAYYKEKQRALTLKPSCDYDLSLSTSTSIIMSNLEHSNNALQLKWYAEAETNYAANRKVQGKHLIHKARLFLTGTSESNDDWIQFLTVQGCFPK
ncbi:MAG TPA: hypothetical protein VLK33_05795 [Terriglobales bacterium]|nr:hypothetical protein [Terriglobales bacterium]